MDFDDALRRTKRLPKDVVEGGVKVISHLAFLFLIR